MLVSSVLDTIGQISKQIEEITAKRKRYLEMLAENLITHEEYREAGDDSVEIIRQLKLKRSELNASLQIKDIAEDIQFVRASLKRFAHNSDVSEEMLNYLVDRIEVNKDGVPIINYRFSSLE